MSPVQELEELYEEAKFVPRETVPPITATNFEHDLNTTHRTDYTPKDMSGIRCVSAQTLQ